ncbi:MAG: DUF1318 domain-containing protein, partial [Gammaproteobacteria bacterium]
MNILRVPLSLLLLLLVAACVTINVYFPAEAAEKAADLIIQDVYGKDSGTPATPEPQSWQQLHGQPQPSVAMLDWLIAPAHAAADISVDSPAIRQLKAAMEKRHRQLAEYYASGAVGMTQNGLIQIRDQKLLALKDRNTVSQLVGQENADRGALYSEIARANGHPEWADEIRQTFSRRWVDNAPGGW